MFEAEEEREVGVGEEEAYFPAGEFAVVFRLGALKIDNLCFLQEMKLKYHVRGSLEHRRNLGLMRK